MNRLAALLLAPAALAAAATTIACDFETGCARLVYVDLYGPDATTRTVIVNALACTEDQPGLWLRVDPAEGPDASTFVALPTVPKATCLQVGHPAVQWGTEFAPAVLGGDVPWPDFAVTLGHGETDVDAMTTASMQRRDPAAPLRADTDGGWHEVAWYGGDCSLLSVP